MKYFVLVLLLLLSTTASANDVYVDVNVASKHLYTDKDGRLNQRNFGVGITYKATDTKSYKMGYFKNSYSKTSAYGLIDYSIDLSDNIIIGVTGGLVTGYNNTNGEYAEIVDNVQIMMLPHVDVKFSNFVVMMGVTPKLLTLQLQYKIN
jgi:hypothetical protein